MTIKSNAPDYSRLVDEVLGLAKYLVSEDMEYSADVAQRAADAITALSKPVEGWRPIETAPKKEFEVIILGRAGDSGDGVPCFWNGEHWCVASVFGQGLTYKVPTHWQPLPPAPTPPEKGKP